MVKVVVRAMYLWRSLGLCHLILLVLVYRYVITSDRDQNQEVEHDLHMCSEGRLDELTTVIFAVKYIQKGENLGR